MFMKSAVFWDVTPYSSETARRFGKHIACILEPKSGPSKETEKAGRI
jgi:hypothetical protein